MIVEMVACIGFAVAGQSQSGPKAMPEMLHQPERDDRLTTEPRPSRERPQGILQYDLDSTYLPDVVGGWIDIVVATDSSTIAAEADQMIREVATLIKERGGMGVWVTAQLTTDDPKERREAALAVEMIVRRLREFGIERVPFRIWNPEERRPSPPTDTLELRVSRGLRGSFV
jgi:hypothetical protein